MNKFDMRQLYKKTAHPLCLAIIAGGAIGAAFRAAAGQSVLQGFLEGTVAGGVSYKATTIKEGMNGFSPIIGMCAGGTAIAGADALCHFVAVPHNAPVWEMIGLALPITIGTILGIYKTPQLG